MKKTGFNLICKLWCTILLCAGILTGCDRETFAGSNQSIRPCKIDMAGVQGFAVVENASNAPRTKADRDGDGVDDDMPNGNGGVAVNTSPYSLYTIDENGELQVSIFYFEAAPSEDGQVNNGPNEQVLKELTGVLQIVPSLVTDLGKYILFSGCQYQILDSDISDEARAICESFVQSNGWLRQAGAYMIRKSDGALFDLTAQTIFTYSAYSPDTGSWYFSYYYPTSSEGSKWAHIPTYTYTTSTNGNLFVRGYDRYDLGWAPNIISKLEDNGDAVTVRQITQPNRYGRNERNFAVDKNENLYEFWSAGERNDYKEDSQIDIYYANGGFNAYDFKPSLLDSRFYKPELFDIVTDESGDSYIFLKSRCPIDNNGVQENNGLWVLSASLSNGEVSPIKEDIVKSEWNGVVYEDGQQNHYYLGYYNDCFNWYLSSAIKYEYDKYKDDEQKVNPNNEILSFNKNTNTWTIATKQLPTGLVSALSANYDVFANGKIFYGANLNGKNIEVTEIDFVSETSRKYTLSTDIPTIVSPSYNIRMAQDIPYLTINGRNTENGAKASITVNLINGETNSSFAKDGRNVVSFFRIN